MNHEEEKRKEAAHLTEHDLDVSETIDFLFFPVAFALVCVIISIVLN